MAFGARVLAAVDARSPVQAIAKFREAHVNRRAEYFMGNMLDELLVEVERMDTVVFYWLRGHSGAVPNEAADLQATEFLEQEPTDVVRRCSQTCQSHVRIRQETIRVGSETYRTSCADGSWGQVAQVHLEGHDGLGVALGQG